MGHEKESGREYHSVLPLAAMTGERWAHAHADADAGAQAATAINSQATDHPRHYKGRERGWQALSSLLSIIFLVRE